MERKMPFDGVRILEWAQAINGPMVSFLFSVFGAEVIKIESTKFPEMLRITVPFKDNIPHPDRAFAFLPYNANKKSLTLNMKDARGIEIFKKLVGWSDIVLQNQRPGLMKEMSLGYEELKKTKKDIILLNVSIAGQEGPLAKVGGWGSNSMAQSGQFYYYRPPDRGPSIPGFTATPDVIVPLIAAMGGIVALDYKRRTGKGQCLDICQLEPLIHFIGPFVLDYMVNGRIPKPFGNRDPHFAPHNVFQCKGVDKWCAITVRTNEEWRGLCKASGNQDLAHSPKFATSAVRKKNETELDELINQWTLQYTPDEVMRRLQEAGVPAGMMQNAQGIVDLDPHMKARGVMLKMHHPIIGDYLLTRLPFLLSKTPFKVKNAPCMGEHTHYVCTKILGMSDEEFVELLNSEVIV